MKKLTTTFTAVLCVGALFGATDEIGMAVARTFADEMRGPFPIMSTPYFADGAVDYDTLAREAQWTDDCGCPGVIWCQSNDAVDLLTTEEKFMGFEASADCP